MNCPPILFLVFNRPDVTARVFAQIRAAKPETLFLAADGPRPNRRGDAKLCQETKRCIESMIDWKCDVRKLYREDNAGCRIAVSSAIDWFFDHVEEGIILEDDCLPDPTFFPFCAELLERYRSDPRIMQIAGSNLALRDDLPPSYCFSRFGPIWGWATWKRAWANYDVHLTDWPQRKAENALADLCGSVEEIQWRTATFDQCHAAGIDTWDYQWHYCKMMASGLTVIPSTNLISNLGFHLAATHTKMKDRKRAALPTSPIESPLIHPETISTHVPFDEATLKQALKNPIPAPVRKTLKQLSPVLEAVVTACRRR